MTLSARHYSGMPWNRLRRATGIAPCKGQRLQACLRRLGRAEEPRLWRLAREAQRHAVREAGGCYTLFASAAAMPV